jgi:hypothetical protein
MAACSVTGSFFTGEREERAREDDRKEGEWRGVQGEVSRGVFSSFSGKQDVARRRPCAGHAGVHPTGRRRKGVFVENPLGFGGFLGNIKNCTLLQYFVKQTRSKNYETWQGLFREVV